MKIVSIQQTALLWLCLLLPFTGICGQQQLTQSIHGYITDAESKQPLPGVTVVVLSNPQLNALSDSNGYYSIENVPVGRQSFRFSFVGYDPKITSEVLVTSGKELELNIPLVENVQKLKEVSITASRKNKALNEFASVSARSFSVEETKRYAASVSDPARMAMNFMGVSNSDDMENGLVVRGNSPKGMLWRLEGIEIPNPNHFNLLGSSGGAVSMLNANTLGTSDFYTGAFPPEIGNALSGAFDLNFRNGNKERNEYSFQLGTLGVEAATEGPFKRGGKSSYLVNYRYSTLTLLQGFFNLGGVLPAYQDASFKLNFPTKKAGTFTVFGLGGYNQATKDPAADSTKWTADNPNFRLRTYGKMGVAGVTHQYFLNSHAYIKTILSVSADTYESSVDSLNAFDNYKRVPTQYSNFINTAFRGSVMYNNKLNSRNTIRTGLVVQQLHSDLFGHYFEADKNAWRTLVDGDGNTQYYQGYLQWKSRLTQKFTLISGVHGSYYGLNEKYSIEPRASLTYQARKSSYTLAAGFHSKPENMAVYMFQPDSNSTIKLKTNSDLDLLRAFHVVAGYSLNLPLGLNFKTELYYQHLYSIPVDVNAGNAFSILNTENIYELVNVTKLVSDGTGKNYGIDLSLEKPLANNYYLMATGSIFRSFYTDYAGHEYHTLYDRGYQVNILGGKEFSLDRKKAGKKVLGLNGKLLGSGGLRESPIDVKQSVYYQQTIYVPGQFFSQQGKPYFRIDGSAYYKFNRKRSTHSIELDVQNITNRQNYFYSFFDKNDGTIKTVYETGIIPTIAYRIDFH